MFTLRWLALAGQLAGVLAATWILSLQLPLMPMLLTIFALAAFNFWSSVHLHGADPLLPVTEKELFGQLLVDILALTALLYFSGGAANPFVSLYLLPISVAASILSSMAAWGLVATTLLSYSLLMVYHVPLPHVAMFGHDQFWGHQIGMWLTFVIAALMIVWFLLRAAIAIRLRDRELALARETAMRHEHLVGIGTLAAGAAHELGTPLSTMAVLVEDMRRTTGLSEDMRADLQMLNEQIQRCKRTLGELSRKARAERGENCAALPIRAVTHGLLDDWLLLRPLAQVECRFLGEGDPEVIFDVALQRAIQNLLNNAADASKTPVEVEVAWSSQKLTINILDRGSGLTPEVLSLAGEAHISTKPDGLGIGLMLANATIERLGGRVAFSNRDGGGASILVVLPQSIFGDSK